nr:glycerol kinase GlpK [uncultured Desulfobacter sp.]
MSQYIMALDQGTTSSRTILYNETGEAVAVASEAFPCQYPKDGWVEQDAEEIWRSQKNTMDAVLEQAKLNLGDVAAIGIANQRETIIAWNTETGKPVGKAIVWQCRRTADYCDRLKTEGFDTVIKEKTGLVTDAYFSGSKIRWILRHSIEARELCNKGKLKVGTVDAWLIWKLTAGVVHATDVSNASRTMIFNIHDLKYDPVLMEKLEIPEEILPHVNPSCGIFGKTNKKLFGHEIPIAGVAGDQQAALFGQAAFEKGMTKITYGTGCFMLMNTGSQAIASPSGLLTTIAWQIGDNVTYALEGSVFVAGALLQWMRDDLNFFSDVAQTEEMATAIPSSEGLYIVPAFVGLGAPYWDPYARGAMLGITRGTTKNHIIRAGLQSLAYQANDLIGAMVKDSGIKLKTVNVDGGASANNYLCQFQADILGVSLCRPKHVETTAMGAAYLAGLAVGVWADMDQIKSFWQQDRCFHLNKSQEKVDECLQGWRKAVDRAKSWAKT